MKRGKVYIDFETIKETFGLPEDALLKRYNIDTLDDTVEIEFYSNEGTTEMSQTGSIRRERLVKPSNITVTINVDNLNKETLEEFTELLEEHFTKKENLRGLV